MKYKYFSRKTDPKMVGVYPALMRKLDHARRLYGYPIIITSGKRSKSSKIGVKNSAHNVGLAVDMRAPKKQWKRERLIWALANASLIARLGSYNNHFHVDIDFSKPNPVFWWGKSK